MSDHTPAPATFKIGPEGMAVMWLPLGEYGPAFDAALQPERTVDLARARAAIWERAGDDLEKLEDHGWEVCHDDQALRAFATKPFESFDDAQDNARDVLYGRSDRWLPGRDDRGTTRRFDWYGGKDMALKLGGFVAGEEPRPTPDPFPMWIVAPEVQRARKTTSEDEILPELMKLGFAGSQADYLVVQEIANLDRPLISPRFESFAGMGEIELVSEAWIRHAGRIEVLTETPGGYGSRPWIRDYLAVPAIAEIWAEAAREQATRSQLKVEEEIDEVLATSLIRVAAQGGPRKVKPSAEQLDKEFGAQMEEISRQLREERTDDPDPGR